MSFVITSNTSTSEQNPFVEGINRPFSYFNNLQDTLKISKNSEIAVQSVKINKEGTISVDPSNNQFYLYYGTKLTNAIDINQTTSAPIYQRIVNGDNEDEFVTNVDDFAGFVESAFIKANPLPNNLPHFFAGTGNASGVVVNAKRSASGVDFQGFSFDFFQSASSDNQEYKENMGWIPSYIADVGKNFVINASTVVNNEADDVVLIAHTSPLSLANGSWEVDISDFDHDQEEWAVGLTRCTRLGRRDANGSYSANPDGDLEEPSYFDGNGNFYDYVLQNDIQPNGSYQLRLFHATFDVASDELEMTEVDYRLKLGIANYIDANASNITIVEWGIKNEQVTCRIFNAGAGPGTGYITLADGLNANASRNLKPLNQCCWHIFPKIEIPGGKTIVNQTYQGIAQKLGLEYGAETFNSTTGRHDQTYNDWWATNVNLGEEDINCKPVDSRYMIQSGNTTAYTQKGLVGGQTLDKDYVLVLTQSNDYVSSVGANSNVILGFKNRGVVDTPNTTGNPTNFTSDSVPTFLSSDSLFVRLKNMTFNSVNFSKSSESKILYHLPRFDNAGLESGGLFFEPAERVYLKLNNLTDIFISDIEVDIVKSDETLADSLTGKTIVCFHIRDAKI